MTFQISPFEANFLEDVQRLYNGPNVHFYVVGFANIARPNNYLKRVNKALSGVIDSDVIAAMRGGKDSKIYTDIVFALKETTFPKLTIGQLPTDENDTNIILVGYDKADQFSEICIYLKERLNYLQGEAVVYPHACLKYSAVINYQYKVLDQVAFLRSWPIHMQISHMQIPSNDYGKFLNETGAGGNVISNGRFYQLADAKGKYFNITNGQRKVCYGEDIKIPSHNILILGDSKITGPKLSDEETIPSQLQLYFSKDNLPFKVSQYSYNSAVPFELELQLKQLSLLPNTVVLCSSSARGNLFFRDKVAKMPKEEKALHYAIPIVKMYNYCKKLNSPFLFFTTDRDLRSPNPTDTEKFLWNSYSPKEYRYEIDEHMLMVKKYCIANGVPYYDLSYLLTKPNRFNYLSDLTHFSPEAAHDIAFELGDILRYMLVGPSEGIQSRVEKSMDSIKADFQNDITQKFETPQLIAYLNNLKEISANKPSNSGVIVMNCNPFTLGHRYLIETARAQVEQLYILVVEEDKSAFKFKDRFEMIRLGVADIPNVEVLPSGEFVISTITFPEYFDKDAKQSEKIDPSFDVEIFCNKIAPALGCTKRFVGEEPLDLVTNQYNQKMAEILPKHGMELVVIPRKEQGDAPISASRVRKLMGEGRYEELAQLVPTTTYDYLIAMNPQA